MTKKSRFDKLLEPYHIGQVKISNRMVKAASGTMILGDEGIMNEKYLAYYDALARGGVGLITIEDSSVEYHLGAHHPPFQPRIDDDKYIPGYSELVRVIHKYGTPTFLQLMHAGAWDAVHLRKGKSVAASAISESELPGDYFDTPRELTLDEIEQLVDKFASASVRAQKAGFDGVEINGSHSHLINSFLSRFWNRRSDAYGCGSLENRARFAVEIIREVKRRLGEDFPVGFLMNGAEVGIDNGITIEEAQGLAKILEDAGIDSIHIRAHGYGDYANMLRPENVFYPEPPKHRVKQLDWNYKGAGFTVPLAAAVKRVVSIPVITVGRLDPEMGEKILQDGKADFIAFARRLMADPELPHKIAAGNLVDIAPCTACLECNNALRLLLPVRCRVNAALGGEEKYYAINKTERKKKVVVVGGGPAGMEAARVLAIRGHEVILYEKEPRLGGLLPLAALVKGCEVEDLTVLVDYLKAQVSKLGVKTRLGKEFTAKIVEEIRPDTILLATGSLPATPEIPGINRRNVISSSTLHHKVKTYLRFLSPKIIRWLTKFWMPIGKKVVIIGGQIQGCELAEFLVKRGRKVIVVDTAERLGDGLAEERKPRLFEWLTKKGAILLTGVRYEKITDKGLTLITNKGKRQTIEVDTILTAIPPSPNTGLLEALKEKPLEIHLIGDCSEPRLIIDAIADGYHTAWDI